MRGAWLGAAVFLAAPASFALGFGTPQGVPLIGRPLDVAIPVTLDPGTDPGSACARAEVQQGEVMIEGATARFENMAGASGLLRIRTQRLIEEPVVTVAVHVGCFLKVSRRFVLLSELPGDASSAQLQFTPQLPAVPAARSAPAAPRAAAPAPRGRAEPSAGATPAPRGNAARTRAQAQLQGVEPAPPPRAAATRRAAAPAPVPSVVRVPARNRLRLDPIDLAAEPEPRLKLSMAINAVPEVSPQRRAEAAAVWRALNKSPVDVMQDYERMQAMEVDLKAMRGHILSNKAEVDAMRIQLQKAEAEADRKALGLTLLAAALFAMLVIALYMGRRAIFQRRGDENWWKDSRLAAAKEERGADRDPHQATQVFAQPYWKDEAAEAAAQLDFDLSQYSSDQIRPKPGAPALHEIGDLGPGPISAFSHLDFQSSQPASWRSLTSEELHDIQEQADFFVSLGDYDRAVNVLMSHVQASPQTSALAWMALLDLHHRLGRRQGYEGLRDQIERRMNVIVPPFENYSEPSASLEAYADAMERIVSLWPSARVLDLIEESIYRMPGASSEPFALTAFHELLLLYSIGRAVIKDSDAPIVDIETPDAVNEDEFPMTSIVADSAELNVPSDEDVRLFATLLAGSKVDVDLGADDDATVPNGRAGRAGGAGGGFPDAAKQDDNLIDFDDFDAATSRVGAKPKNYPR